MEKQTQPERKQRWHRKQASIGATLALITAIYGLVTAIGAFTVRLSAPAFLSWLAEARAEDVRKQIKTETAPTETKVDAMIQDKIDELKAEVGRLEAQKSRDPSRFSDADADKLSLAQSRLSKLEKAQK